MTTSLLVLVLAGCANGSGGGYGLPGTASPTAETSAPATPTATPVPAAVTLPDCEALVPLTLLQAVYSTDIVFDSATLPAEPDEVFPDAAAAAAYAAADPSAACTWVVPDSDGFVRVIAGILEAEERAQLEASLPAAGFAAVDLGGDSAYAQELPSAVATQVLLYAFHGPLWVAVFGPDQEAAEGIATTAIDSVVSANPDLE